jgi:hypothetical protein
MQSTLKKKCHAERDAMLLDEIERAFPDALPGSAGE